MKNVTVRYNINQMAFEQGEKEMNDQRVKISGLDIPFVDLVVLMVKLAFASIPAMIVIYFVFVLLGIFFDGFLGLLMVHPPVP